MPTEELDDLEQLERIVPKDLSDWPPYAQVLYLQTRALTKQVAGLKQAIEGQDGIRDTIADHERRIKALEAMRNWFVGIGTAVVTTLAVTATVAATIWRK